MSAPPDDALTARQVAERVGVTVRSFYTYVARGDAPQPDGRLGHTPYWFAATIDQWLAGRPGRGRGSRRASNEGES